MHLQIKDFYRIITFLFYILQKNETRFNQMIVASVGTLTIIIRNSIRTDVSTSTEAECTK